MRKEIEMKTTKDEWPDVIGVEENLDLINGANQRLIKKLHKQEKEIETLRSALVFILTLFAAFVFLVVIFPLIMNTTQN